ncbi:CRISPR-associated helicase Cas3' [Nocardia sp. NPDC005366]|uniref:CRISPR-associated helicase Cas3' n=1 Tax=Nocardia sp. NPDC005366 TaxID=3156878 RepID=UPI0033B03315
MKLWAHSRSDVSGVRHGLDEHSRSTAWWAARFASAFGEEDLAFALGLYHDTGKAGCGWQQRLIEVEPTGARVGLPHKEVGARALRQAVGLAGIALLGHHGGLESRTTLRDVWSHPDAVDDPEVLSRFFGIVPEASGVRLRNGMFAGPWAGVKDKLVQEMRLRLVFSALVDADHLDTAAHRQGLCGPQVAAPADMSELIARFEHRRAASIGASTDQVAQLRAQVYQAAVDVARSQPGLFRLAAPTGLGKTFAQGIFGLRHAAQWGKSRVIVAVPFVTITEQNADVYRGLLDEPEEPVVLEHHASIRFDDTGGDPGTRWARLAAENWDAPFVVTTTVQLFESLFGRKPSQMRKVHRLANAVVILDEVQALPSRLLLPILSALRTLTEEFGTTVLLTSATQPQFQALSVWQHSAERDGAHIREVITDPQPLFVAARRVRYEWKLDPQPTWEEITQQVAALTQVMVVVNSVADARALYRMVSTSREDVWHLSTRMCPAHRRAVLAMVQTRLTAGRSIVLVSTQLVEAGVDLSFPVVWRALAPADSLQQAAGRANRHGEHSQGVVVVFDPAQGHRPADYAQACALTTRMFGPHGAQLDDQAALADYYGQLYNDLGLDRRSRSYTTTPVGQLIQQHREDLDFRAVTDGPLFNAASGTARDRKKAFRMIDQDSVPIVIDDQQHRHEIDPLLADLAAGNIRAGLALRKLQPWTVQLRTDLARRSEIAALIQPVAGDLGRWQGTYDWTQSTARGVGLDEADMTTIF